MRLPALSSPTFASLIVFPLLASAALAHADIYGYTDEDGIAHFSVEKLDARYRLYMKGNGAFDSAGMAADDGLEGVAGQGGIKLKPAMLRYLEQHPNLKKYEPLLEQAASDFSLDPALLKAVMAAESGFNPAAVSPKGAIGLMQLMPATAERYGLHGDGRKSLTAKLTDPKTNIRLGARYLSDLTRMFPGRQHLVLASYNAGEGAVQKYSNRIPPYPETRNYVQLVTRFHRLYRENAGAAGMGAKPDSAGSGLGPRRVRMTIPGRREAAQPSAGLPQAAVGAGTLQAPILSQDND